MHLPANAPSDLFITHLLDERAHAPVDYAGEARAMLALARHMAEAPDQVLPSFVDLAMTVTGANSAGLSLLEPEPAPGVFRWRCLAPFEGATTPRDFSPCGVTLDQDAPLLTLHPERTYDWIEAAGVVAPEVLLVPLYIGGAEPLGTLWVVADEGRFTREHARVLQDIAVSVGLTLKEAAYA
jgi:hypothetical protein